MQSKSHLAARLRAVAAAAIFAFTTFAVSITPVALPITRPLGLAPKAAEAVSYCASAPSFTGRLTASGASTVAVSRITNANVFGYLSNVDAAWSCTLYYRYSGLAYNTSPTLGTFDYGALIHSTSVACNWVVGSTDFLKANDSADCPDTDAEYAMAISLSAEGTYINNGAHTATGQFSWVHSDCATTTFYGTNGEAVKTGQTFSTSITGNRPGANCDPMELDNTATAQSITYDHTVPTVSISAPAAGQTAQTSLSYSVAFNPSDNLAGFGGTHLWSLQRYVATITSPNVCGSFGLDGAAVTGTTQGSQNSVQTLSTARCYQWILSASDQNGNGPVSTPVSGKVLVDSTAPAVSFTAPPPGITTVTAQSYAPTWSATDPESGIASTSLQRQIVGTTAACSAGPTNDGAPSSSGSGTAYTLALGTCYQWVLTVANGASAQTVATSGKLFVDSASPSADFNAPDEGTTTITSNTAYSVAWAETPGAGQTITTRSLQRYKIAVTIPNTCSGTPSVDGTAVTTASPASVTGLTSGNCYRWSQTLTNSAGKQGSSTSGWVLVDTGLPTATIALPEVNRTAGGLVAISGTASDALTFKNYQLEYGVGATPASWTTIGSVSTTPVTGGALGSWATGALNGVYTIRLTSRDNANNTTTAQALLYLQNTRRGEESYWDRVPFDLGGGYSLGIGVANGEATLDRDLFSIPSFGPPQALSLHYSSLETATTGRFGSGWISNLTQYLTYDNGFVVWHPADGGVVPFGQVGSTWTPLRGNFETLTRNASEDVVTFTDQTKAVFSNTTGLLKRLENRFGKTLTLAWNGSTATASDATTSPGPRVLNMVLDGSGRITDATDSAGRHWAFRFNASGDMDRITDPAGNYADLAYTAHQLISVTRTRSRLSGGDETITWSIGYTSGNATSVTDPVNASVANTFAYNASSTDANLLKDYAGPVRTTTRYDYDDLGRVTALTQSPDGLIDDNLDYRTTYGYDADSNVLTLFRPIQATDVQPAVGQATAFTYDARGNMTSEVDDLDGSATVKTLMTYNATNDLLARSEDDLGALTRVVTLNTYVSGHLLSVDENCTTSGTTPPSPGTTCTGFGTQDNATNLLTSYAYTANDQLLTETDPLLRVTKHIYDTYGNETSVVANCTTSGTAPPAPPSSCTAAGTHDAQTNVTTSSGYDATSAGKAGIPTSTTDAVGSVTSMTYDPLGRQLAEVLSGDSSIPILTRTTTYDQLDNVLTGVESWTGVTRSTTHVYNAADRETNQTDLTTGVSTQTSYDAAGNATRTIAGGVQTDRTFDLMGRQTDEAVAGSTTHHDYDGQGREIHTDDPTGGTTDRVLDLAGRLLIETVSDAGGDLVTQHAYDPLGREITTTNAAGTTTSGYDRTGRLLTTLVGTSTTTNAYDRNGNQTKVTGPAPLNIVTTTVYDPLNRATQTIANDVPTKTLPTEDVTTTTYFDAAGRTIAVKDPKDITTRSIQNVRGLPLKTIENCTDSGTTPTSNPPACTGAGTHTTTANVVTTITYDGSGAETIRLVNHGDGTTATTTVAYEGGRERAIQDPRGTISRTLYDTSGRVASRVVNCTNQTSPGLPTGLWYDCAPSTLNDGTWNVTTSYSYDSHGNKATETAPNGRVTSYVYDAADRLTRQIANYVASPTQADQNLTTWFGYDDAGRQIAVRAPTLDRDTYAVTRTVYDTAGRVTSVIRNCTNSGVVSPPDPDWVTCTGAGTRDSDTNLATSYTYDAKSNRITTTEPDPADSTGSGATVTTQSAYDADNRLCRVVQNATGGTDLQALATPCSSATQGTGTTTANVSTRYTYDGSGNLTSMVDARGKTTSYAYDASAHMTGLTDPDSGAMAWTFDSLGRRTGQTNRGDTSAGSPTVSWTYDGAGRVLSRTFETAPASDTTAPAVPASVTATAIAGNRVNLTWSAATDNVGVTKYTIRRGGAILTAVSGATTSFSDFSVAGTTPYAYTVDATDAANNSSAQSTAAGATTPAGLTTVTTLSATADTYVDATNGGTKNNNYGTATWLFVDANHRTWLKYDASALPAGFSLARLSIETNSSAFDGVSSVRSSATTSWTETGITWNNQPTFGTTSLGTLGSNGANVRTYLTVTSTVAAPGIYTFVLVTTGTTSANYFSKESWPGAGFEPQLEITTPLVDAIAPSAPSGLIATAAGPGRVDLTWTASTDAVGVQGYKLYRNGSFVTTVGSPSWSDLGLTAATAYSYTVAAIDAAGNTSAQSSTANATTAAASVTTSYTYDPGGNRLTAVDATGTITSAYDRLNRPTSVSLSADAAATTTYTYSLTSPAWTDPSGSYAVALDKFDREAGLTDPIHGASAWATTYRADGQPASLGAPNGNATAFGYDDAGTPSTKVTTGAGPVTRAAYTLARNRAGEILTEDSQLTGDPTNGPTTYTYDPLARLTGFTRGATTAYGWDKVPNRTSVQAGAGTPVTTSFDNANRPLADAGGATGAYSSDPDGRLTSRPGQRLDWDAAGRLVRVRPATGTAVSATFTYDALDRLLTADEGGLRTRYRYVGQTTALAQTVNDATGVAIRSIATSWAGERLADWTAGGTGQRFSGTNLHHDVTWTADATGVVSATLRYDPFGTLTGFTGTSLPDVRFQGSLYDSTADMSWAVTRWYAPTLGRFVSEDSLLGTPADPPSQHLYAYGAGDPTGRVDPDGRTWYRVGLGETVHSIAARFRLNEIQLRFANPGRVTPRSLLFGAHVRPGDCIWLNANVLTLRRCYPYPGAGYRYPLYSRALYANYDNMLSFIFDRMQQDRRNGAGGVGQWSDCWMVLAWCYWFNADVLGTWGLQVMGGSNWDYKQKLAKWGKYTPVRHDEAPEMLYYDVWTNIHYGYVGRAHKIPKDILHAGAEQLGGSRSVSDWVANEIGMQLWDRFGADLRKADIEESVLENMKTFRNDSAFHFIEVHRGLAP